MKAIRQMDDKDRLNFCNYINFLQIITSPFPGSHYLVVGSMCRARLNNFYLLIFSCVPIYNCKLVGKAGIGNLKFI